MSTPFHIAPGGGLDPKLADMTCAIASGPQEHRIADVRKQGL